MSGDGGPAFPAHDFRYYPGGGGAGVHTMTGGMSLRDWFAGQALAGIMAASARLPRTAGLERDLAEIAYVLADAMLAARERDDG